MRKMPIKIISSITLIGLLLASCGKSGGGGSSGAKENEETPAGSTNRTNLATDGSNIQGYYKATFITLNPQVNGTLPGSVTLYRKEDRLFAYLRLFAGHPKAWHQQKIYTGDRCPTQSDDKNNDGYIDIFEAEAVLGKVLIPLDADLGTQNSGRNFYPVGDLSGSYHYERVVNFQRFFNDLKAEDKDPDDNMVKLAADEPLDFEGKVIMIQGTAETVEYPETVRTTERHKAFQTLPIVCGIFEKADVTPGSAYSEDIPGPIADVVEGQDIPAPEDDTTTTPGGGTTTSGGNNDSDRGESETEDESGNHHPGGNNDSSTTGGTSGGRSDGGTTGSSSGGFIGGFIGGSDGGTTGSTTGGESSSGTTTGN